MTANTFATEDYADAAAAAVVDSAPGTLDTLNELAAALGDDANFATTVTAALAGKQPLDSDLTAIAALTTTSYGRAFLELANAAAGLTALGLDADLSTFSLPASTTISAFGASLVDDAAASNARTTLGLGTAATSASGDFQPIDSDLTAIAALTTTSFGRGLLELANAAAAIAALGLDADLATLSLPASTTISAFGASLIDDAAASNARTTLGLGTAATSNTGDFDAAGAAAAAQAASQPLDADLTTLAGLTPTTDNIIQSVAGAWASRTPAQVRTALALVIGTNVQAWDADLDTLAANITAFGHSLVDDANAAAALTTLGLDADLATLSLPASTTISSFVAAALDETTVGAFLTALGIDADLATLAVPVSTTISSFVAGALDETTIAAFLTTLGLDADVATLSLPASTTISAFGATLVDDANAAAAIATLGLDADIATLALPASTTITAVAATVLDDTTTAAMLTTLGAQPVDSDLTTLAGLTATTDNMIQSVGSAWASRTPSQVRTALGLVIGTNVQAYDADLTTYAGITPGALGQAILPMTTLTNKGLVLGRGASAPAALAPDAGTTKFLKNSVASDDPTWQVVAQADVSGLTTADTPTFAGVTLGTGTVTVHQGWVADANTWVYASANSFTIAADATSYLFPGTKVSYDDGDGSIDYGVVVSAVFSTPTTTVTLIANSTHAIADPGGSHVLLTPRFYNGAARPIGFNNVFTWAPGTITGYSANPTSTAYRYSTMGNWITVVMVETVDGTASAALRTYSAPVAAATSSTAQWQTTAALSDNGANLAAPGLARILSAGTVIDIFKDYASTAFTNTAASRVRSVCLIYPF